MPPPLPAPTGTPYRIGLVCLGNICRSPMAATVLNELVDRAGLASAVEVTSSGTGGMAPGSQSGARAVNSGSVMAWVTRSPCFRMCSTCAGHGSMKVTSSPACTICAPA